MTDLVDPTEIEEIVGTARDKWVHYGRMVTDEGVFYILHSQGCLDSGRDLRDCLFSRMLDSGLDIEQWSGYMDQPIRLSIANGGLVPYEW